ncbi:hypothetical protein ANCDUO_05714 [Ancylostoma duodenale]|uniref:Neurotransmitter-gated ion-channel transmembrane domain-containing protein n=1 Tax=Ancylostoma duodenale TaxID=51022 RepID=A0A0C2D3G5_9BILA|nr:hypothetical protein ANCDUO_05714 [Ancylostoma duodenale]
MGLTSLLSMSVLLLMISENLPKTNEGLPILGSWRHDKNVPPCLMTLARFKFCPSRIHKNDEQAEFFVEEFHNTDGILKRDSITRSQILARIGNFEHNVRVISANLQRKAAQKRLRMRWVRVCERIDSLLLVVFLTANTTFFVAILLVGYLSN